MHGGRAGAEAGRVFLTDILECTKEPCFLSFSGVVDRCLSETLSDWTSSGKTCLRDVSLQKKNSSNGSGIQQFTLLRRHEGHGASMFDLSPGVASCGHVVCSGISANLCSDSKQNWIPPPTIHAINLKG